MLGDMITSLEASSKNHRANIAKYNAEIKKYRGEVDRYDTHQSAVAEATRISSLNDKIKIIPPIIASK